MYLKWSALTLLSVLVICFAAAFLLSLKSTDLDPITYDHHSYQCTEDGKVYPADVIDDFIDYGDHCLFDSYKVIYPGQEVPAVDFWSLMGSNVWAFLSYLLPGLMRLAAWVFSTLICHDIFAHLRYQYQLLKYKSQRLESEAQAQEHTWEVTKADRCGALRTVCLRSVTTGQELRVVIPAENIQWGESGSSTTLAWLPEAFYDTSGNLEYGDRLLVTSQENKLNLPKPTDPLAQFGDTVDTTRRFLDSL